MLDGGQGAGGRPGLLALPQLGKGCTQRFSILPLGGRANLGGCGWAESRRVCTGEQNANSFCPQINTLLHISSELVLTLPARTSGTCLNPPLGAHLTGDHLIYDVLLILPVWT